MKTLRDYVVNGALYQGDTGPEAQVGDQIKLFLDTEADPGFPDFVLGVIQHPIVKVQCGVATSYVVEYDETDLLGAAALLRPGDVVDATIVSAVDALAEVVESHTHVSVDITDASAEPVASKVVLYNGAGALKSKGYITLEDVNTGFVASFNADESITADRNYGVPNYDCELAGSVYLRSLSPSTGNTITSTPRQDSTIWAAPGGVLATLTWQLPSAENARLGQVCSFASTQAITALTVTNDTGGATLHGTTLAAAVADTLYSFLCVSVAGNGQWLRTR